MALKQLYSILILTFILSTSTNGDTDNVIVLFKYTKDGIEFICVDDYKRHYYFLLVYYMVDHKE